MFPEENPRPKVPFNKIEDYSPDANPSFSELHRERSGEGSEEETRYAMVVRGLGVVIIHMCRKDRSIKMSVFEKELLGYSPNI